MGVTDGMVNDGHDDGLGEFGRRAQDPAPGPAPKISPYPPSRDPITADGGGREIPYDLDVPPVAPSAPDGAQDGLEDRTEDAR